MSTDAGSMEAAFRDACDVPVIGGGSSEQLELLRSPEGKLPADAYRRMRMDRAGPGRRPGSRNKRNTDLAKLICQQAGDPVLFMASVYATELDQLVEMLLIAEGVPEQQDRLAALCDDMAALVRKAYDESWGEERLKAATKGLEAIERAASALKSKPGDIALKALGHQLNAAREVAGYVHSKKPVEATVNHKVDGVIFMPAPQVSAADPIDAVMRRTVEAINSGAIDPAQITDLRFDADAGAFVHDGDASDGDGDDDFYDTRNLPDFGGSQ